VEEIRRARTALFRHLEDPATADTFFEHVAEDVDWTVMGTHPVAGRYHDKATIKANIERLRPLMRDPVRFVLRDLHVDGDTTVAELQAASTTLEGAPYDMGYCWVCRFRGDTIVEVRAYLDSAMVSHTFDRNQARRAGSAAAD
jgi:ketosteroid isomerase-like protein